MKNIRLLMATMALAGLVYACGSSSSPATSESPTITSIAGLPSATSPMASASASINQSLAKAIDKAVTGQVLGTVTGTSNLWDDTKSRGSCEVFNFVKGGIKSAGQADQILCYVKAMDASEKFARNGSGSAINIYDGAWHIFNLNLNGGVNTPYRVKMKIDKDPTTLSITSFKMYMCNGTADSLAQSEYVEQTIDGSTFVMKSIGQFSDVQGSGWHLIDVLGTLNADKLFTTKRIITAGTNTSDTNVFQQYGKLTQNPGSFKFEGSQYGEFSGDYVGTFTNTGYAEGEIIGDTGAASSMMDMAMGDGAVKFNSYGTFGGQSNGDENGAGTTESWDGDTLLVVAAGNAFTTVVSEHALPSKSTVTFTDDFTGVTIGEGTIGDVSWDCTDDVEVGIVDLVASEESTIQAACTDYSFDGDSWINCYQKIQSSQEQGNNDSYSGTYDVSKGLDCTSPATDGLPTIFNLVDDGNGNIIGGDGTMVIAYDGTTTCTATLSAQPCLLCTVDLDSKAVTAVGCNISAGPSQCTLTLSNKR